MSIPSVVIRGERWRLSLWNVCNYRFNYKYLINITYRREHWSHHCACNNHSQHCNTANNILTSLFQIKHSKQTFIFVTWIFIFLMILVGSVLVSVMKIVFPYCFLVLNIYNGKWVRHYPTSKCFADRVVVYGYLAELLLRWLRFRSLDRWPSLWMS